MQGAGSAGMRLHSVRIWLEGCPRDGVATLVVFLGALGLYCLSNDFQLGLHPDEVKKVGAILQDRSYYAHPLLMTEAVRFVVRLLGVTDPQAAVEVGRALSALMGAIAVVALFHLLLRRTSLLMAMLISLATLSTPLLAVHAHYLKEDVWLLTFCVLTTIAFDRLLARPEPSSTILLGLAVGLAVSSKTIGMFLVPVLVVAALLHASDVRGRLLRSVLLATIVAAAVVVLVNMRMLFDYDRALAELIIEIRHGTADGHWDRIVYPTGYHLTHSLAVGVGPTLLTLGLAGLLATVLRWRLSEPTARLMVVYAIVYYAMIEVAPLKAWPDVARYALPLIAPLAYFAACAIDLARHWLGDRRYPRVVATAAGAAIAIAFLPAALTGVRLVKDLGNDTRLIAEQMLRGRDWQLITEEYGTTIGFQVWSVGLLNLRSIAPNIRYLLASSFLYDRFAIGAAVGGAQNADATRIWDEYQAIFEMPYCEIRPHVMSYGFSNPTIRIVDLLAARAGEIGSRYDTSLGTACAAGPPEHASN
jgi:hypothetical protein